MRAWIEIDMGQWYDLVLKVALFMRAWIEIGACLAGEYNVCSRPLHEGVD